MLDSDSKPPDQVALAQMLFVQHTAALRGFRVAHYVDGHEVSAQVLNIDLPLGFGRAEIGNWNPATRRDRTLIRTFNGRMDEMLVFRRALGAQEVCDLAHTGPIPSIVPQ